MGIKKYLNSILNLFNGNLYCFFRNTHFKIVGFPIRVHSVNNNYYVTDGENKLFLATKVRCGRYAKGIKQLIERLASIYFLDKIDFNEGDVFIDCGANIGELGVWLNSLKTNIKYIAYEPSENEYKALCLNVPNGTNIKKALWFENRLLEFYLDVENADSSLIYNGSQHSKAVVEAVRLDTDQVDVPKIKLLKVEAEGAEPEVLQGCENILNRCEYITVEAGGERGPEALETVEEVTNFLLSRNFKLIKKSEGRVVCLFKNMNI